MPYGIEDDANTLIHYPIDKSWAKANYPNISFPADWSGAVGRDLSDILGVPSTLVQVDPRGIKPAPSDPAAFKVVAAPPTKQGVNLWQEQWVEVALTAQEAIDYTNFVESNEAVAAAKVDTLLQQFANSTPAQVENYIDTNVNNLQSAKPILITLAKAVLHLIKRELKA